MERPKIRVTGVVRRNGASSEVQQVWSAHRGSTASATAVASAARVVNPQVQTKVLTSHASVTSVGTREPSPSPEKSERRRPISEQRVVVRSKLEDEVWDEAGPTNRLRGDLLDAQASAQHSEKESIEKRCAALEQQLAEAKKALQAEKEGRTARSKDENEDLKTENQRLRAEVGKAFVQQSEKESLEKRNAALEQQLAEANKALQAEKESRTARSKHENEDLKTENQRLRAELRKAFVQQSEKESLEKRNAALEQQLAEANKALQAEKESRTARSKDENDDPTENQRFRAELSEASDLDEGKFVLPAERESFEKRCAVYWRSRCAALERQLVEARRMEEALDKEQAEKKSLEVEKMMLSAEKEALQAEKESLEVRCQSLEKGRKVGWAETALAVPEDRPMTGNSRASSGTILTSIFSFESAASHASLMYCSTPNSLRSVAEWVFPLQNRILAPEKTYDRQLLAPSDPRRQWLEEYINGSLMAHRKAYDSDEWCSAPQIEIIRVSEVFNPIVNQAYYQQVTQMSEVWGTDRSPVPELQRAIPIRTAWDQTRMNEVLLFHGCKWDSLFGILREGFDPRLGGINTGAAFGIGCYFTTVASKADGYTERWDEWDGRPNCEIPSDLRCLLVARVALGEIYEMFQPDSSLRRPPVGPTEMRCDSVLGVPRARAGCVDYDEFVIYKQAQATPQFIVDYKHAQSCTCRSCVAGAA